MDMGVKRMVERGGRMVSCGDGDGHTHTEREREGERETSKRPDCTKKNVKKPTPTHDAATVLSPTQTQTHAHPHTDSHDSLQIIVHSAESPLPCLQQEADSGSNKQHTNKNTNEARTDTILLPLIRHAWHQLWHIRGETNLRQSGLHLPGKPLQLDQRRRTQPPCRPSHLGCSRIPQFLRRRHSLDSGFCITCWDRLEASNRELNVVAEGGGAVGGTIS